jgi:MFS family permease
MAVARNPDSFLVKVSLLAAGSLVILGGAALAPALPAIQAEFSNVPNVQFLVRFVLTLPALLIAITALGAGYFVDRFGRKPILIASVFLSGVAGFSGFFATSLPLILVGRAFLGIATAGLMISTTTLITDYYSGSDRATFLGLNAGIMGIVGTFMLIIVGFLAESSWNLPFLIYLLPFPVLGFVLLVLFEPQLEARCEVTPNSLGEPGACIGEAVSSEKRLPHWAGADEPMPVKLLAFIYGTILLVQIIFYVIPIQLPFYFQNLSGASTSQSGMAISIMAFVFALSSISYGRVAKRLDRISVLTLAMFLLSVGYGFIALASGLVLVYIGLIFAGIGLGIMTPNLYAWLASEAPPALRGRIMGGFTTATFAGQFLSPFLSQPVTAAFDIRAAFIMSAVLALIVVPFILLGRSRLQTLVAKPAQV